MFKQKKLKNPVMTIRKPEEINKEYSEVVFRLGQLAIESEAIVRAQERQDKRYDQIKEERQVLLDKTDALSQEMTEAQKKIQADVKKEEEPAS